MLAIVGLTNRLQGGPWIVDVLVYVAAIFAVAALHVLFLNALPRPEGIPWTVVIPGALLMTIAWLLIRLATVVYFSMEVGQGQRALRRAGDGGRLPRLALHHQPVIGRLHIAERDDLAAGRGCRGGAPGVDDRSRY